MTDIDRTMPSLPTVHVLHVDGNILEINNNNSNDNNNSGTVVGGSAGGGAGTTSGSASASITGSGTNTNSGSNTLATSSSIPSTGVLGGIAGGGSASLAQPPGGAMAAGDSSTTTHISIARPLISPPTVSGIGCAPLQEEPGVVAGAKNRLNITSVINNSNVGNRKNHYTNNRFGTALSPNLFQAHCLSLSHDQTNYHEFLSGLRERRGNLLVSYVFMHVHMRMNE